MHDDTEPAQRQTGIHYQPTEPDFSAVIAELQGGTVAQLATRLMADVAMATAQVGDSRKKGKLVLTLVFTPTNGDRMLDIEHTLEYRHPTDKGWKAEAAADVQAMFVNRKGALTVTPDTQGSFKF